jgi:hypothetical protein
LRYPKLLGSKTFSKIGSRRLTIACWHTRTASSKSCD